VHKEQNLLNNKYHNKNQLIEAWLEQFLSLVLILMMLQKFPKMKSFKKNNLYLIGLKFQNFICLEYAI
jgi:hypothetical protein